MAALLWRSSASRAPLLDIRPHTMMAPTAIAENIDDDNPKLMESSLTKYAIVTPASLNRRNTERAMAPMMTPLTRSSYETVTTMIQTRISKIVKPESITLPTTSGPSTKNSGNKAHDKTMTGAATLYNKSTSMRLRAKIVNRNSRKPTTAEMAKGTRCVSSTDAKAIRDDSQRYPNKKLNSADATKMSAIL